MAKTELQFQSRAQLDAMVSGRVQKLMGFKRATPANLPEVPPVFVFNVSDQPHTWYQAGFDKHVVPACEPGKEVSEPCVVKGIHGEEYLEGDKTNIQYYNGEEVAMAICQYGAGLPASIDMRKRGLFISASNPPAKKDIDAAKVLWTQTCRELLREGDNAAAKGDLKDINEDHRRAAAFLKQQRNWNMENVPMVNCPGCQQPIPVGSPYHQACGAVNDWDKAIALGMRAPEQRPGYVKPEEVKDKK